MQSKRRKALEGRRRVERERKKEVKIIETLMREIKVTYQVNGKINSSVKKNVF